MKTFFNVLYRRILYKIPLKLLLVLLALFAVFFASFSSATFVDVTIRGGVDNFILKSDYGNPEVICFSNVNMCPVVQYTIGINGQYSNSSIFNYYAQINNGDVLNYVCTIDGAGFDVVPQNSTCDIKVFYPTPMTSLQCQTNYSLIPVSSVNQSYCVNNNLCPVCEECQPCSNFTGSISNVYINGINHLGAPNIVMNIAEEIDRDYAYTAGGQNMNIDVVGYNVDYEKMQSVIDLQNYKPTDEDFSSLIAMLAPYTKIIIFFVFLFLIWAWIKKPFKSKKL